MARAKEKFKKGAASNPNPPSPKAKRTVAERSEQQKRRKVEREERETKRREDAEAKEAEQEEAQQALVDEGKIVLTDAGEFWLVQKKEDSSYEIDDRAAGVIEDLKSANGMPVLGKDLQEDHGGSYPLYIPIFSTLKALGYINEYRRRTGERGGGGKAYMWVGPRE